MLAERIGGWGRLDGRRLQAASPWRLDGQTDAEINVAQHEDRFVTDRVRTPRWLEWLMEVPQSPLFSDESAERGCGR